MSEVERKDCTVKQAAAEYKAAKSKIFILFVCGGTGSNFTQRSLVLPKTKQHRKYSQQFVILVKPSNSCSRRYISRCANLIEFFQKTKVSKSIMLSDSYRKATFTLTEKIATFTRSLFAKTHLNRDHVSFALMEMYQKMQESLRLHEPARISYRRTFSTAITPCFMRTSFSALTGLLLSPAIGGSLCNLKTKYDSVTCNPRIWWFEQHDRRSAVT